MFELADQPLYVRSLCLWPRWHCEKPCPQSHSDAQGKQTESLWTLFSVSQSFLSKWSYSKNSVANNWELKHFKYLDRKHWPSHQSLCLRLYWWPEWQGYFSATSRILSFNSLSHIYFQGWRNSYLAYLMLYCTCLFLLFVWDNCAINSHGWLGSNII